MELDRGDTKDKGLGVRWMALSLVVAAFTGAALGLVWQGLGLGSDTGEEGVHLASEAGD